MRPLTKLIETGEKVFNTLNRSLPSLFAAVSGKVQDLKSAPLVDLAALLGESEEGFEGCFQHQGTRMKECLSAELRQSVCACLVGHTETMVDFMLMLESGPKVDALFNVSLAAEVDEMVVQEVFQNLTPPTPPPPRPG
jgi:hypothetical protein